MKTIRFLNAAAFFVPVGVGVVELIIYQSCFYAVVATMVTGALQTLAAILYAVRFPKDPRIWIYFAGSAAFFILLDTRCGDYVWWMPVALFVFLNVIVFNPLMEAKNHQPHSQNNNPQNSGTASAQNAV